MRRLTSLLSTLPLVFAVSTMWGCSDSSSLGSFGNRSTKRDDAASSESKTKATSYALKGSLSPEGAGSITQGLAGPEILSAANNVRISELHEGGKLEPVAEVPVSADGTFLAEVPADPNGVLIAQVLDIGGAIIGSGTLNGLVPFVEAFLVMAPITTLTSLETEVLVTLAKGGVPGFSNYLNVIHTFVDAELANTIATTGVFATDLTTLIGACADAVVAAQTAIVAALESAGITLDLTEYSELQTKLTAGLNETITSSNGTFAGTASNLVAGLKAASTQGAEALDLQIFEAVIAGGTAFSAIMKGGLPATATNNVGFAATHAAFNVETQVVKDAVLAIFEQAGIDGAALDAVLAACDALLAQVAGATNIGGLNAAKANFTASVLGDSLGGVLGLLAGLVAQLGPTANNATTILGPLTQNLTTALQAVVSNVGVGDVADLTATIAGILDALAAFNTGAEQLVPALEAVLAGDQAAAIAQCLALVQSLVAL